MRPYDFTDKTVLVTGASMGLGEAFARQLSQRGAKLILVARSGDRLEALAAELGRAHVIVADLGAAGAAARLLAAVQAAGLAVDVLVNNAGFGAVGDFDKISCATQRGQVDLNVGALVELTHLFLPQIEARRGGFVQVASTAGFQPMPYLAVYAATKAFVLSLGEALWAELTPRGVRCTVLCPGPTQTAFFARAGTLPNTPKLAPADDVVRCGLEAFVAGRASVIHGAGNAATAWATRLMPRQGLVRVLGRALRPRPPAAPPAPH